MSNCAWVTLTTNDAYSLGALVLANSLRRVETAHQLAVLVTPTVSEAMRTRLREVYNLVQEVNVLDSQDSANLALLARPELGITFTKLHAWRLTQYEKCVFLDSDTLVIQNADELFEREELSAAPDVSWPDCFNSGVFVYRPSEETFASLIQFALQNGSFDGGDQGLLNLYYSDWAHKDITKHLPFIYNTTAFASYSYLPAFKQFKDKIKILHFAGKLKPWLLNFNSESKTPYMPSEFQHAADMVQLWWTIFCENVHKTLSDQMLPQQEIYYEEENYWPKMEFQNVTTWTENRHTSDSSSFNKTNYDSGHFFDDIQPYHDPWEDYYEKLEKLNEQNSSNNNNNNDNVITQSSPDRSNDTAAYTDSNSNLNTNSNNNNNNPEPSPPLPQPSPPSDQRRHDHHQYDQPRQPSVSSPAHQHQRIEDKSNRNIPQETETSFIETPKKDKQPQEKPATEHRAAGTTRTRRTPQKIQPKVSPKASPKESPKESPKASPRASATASGALSYGTGRGKFSERDVSNSVKKSTSVSSLSTSKNLKSNINQEKVVVEQSQSKKKLNASEAGLAGALAQVRLGQPRSKEQEDYEALMRRQCWESGNIDFTGRDSFDNIWKKISQTLESNPAKAQGKRDEMLTSADIEDGKIEYDPVTKVKTQYKHIEGGYEVIITTPQQNGTMKTQVKTFYDPKPVTEEELLKQQQEKKVRQSKRNTKEVVQIDKNTTMITREIPGGYEEVYTTIYDDGSKSTRVKTFYDAVEVNDEENDETTKKTTQNKKKTNKLNRNNTEEEENVTQKKTNQVVATNQKQVRKVDDDEEYNIKQEQTVEETRRVTKKTEVSNKKTSVSVQEDNVKAVTSKDNKKKKGKKAPPPPADFVQNDTTTVASKNVPGGVEYTYTTTLESGKTITTSKTIYEEEETELTEEEIIQYKKQLKDAEKHKNVTTTKKLKSESGTKKIVPSENPGDVTTVETIKIEGGTEYHYTTVTAEGIVKKAVKTIYDPTPVNNPDETDEEEYVEEYEEEIIEPGEKIVKTIETTKTLPQKYEETIEVSKKKEKKSRK